MPSDLNCHYSGRVVRSARPRNVPVDRQMPRPYRSVSRRRRIVPRFTTRAVAPPSPATGWEIVRRSRPVRSGRHLCALPSADRRVPRSASVRRVRQRTLLVYRSEDNDNIIMYSLNAAICAVFPRTANRRRKFAHGPTSSGTRIVRLYLPCIKYNNTCNIITIYYKTLYK